MAEMLVIGGSEMKLSAPIFRLKRKARLLSREAHIPLHEALDRVAVEEGFPAWSLLSAKFASSSPASSLLAQLKQGDLVLVAARPGQGKTMLSLELAVGAMKAGAHSLFFTLEYTARDCEARLREIGVEPDQLARFELDTSDDICAAHISTRLADAKSGTFVVVDCLQLLDQKRDTPPLDVQVRELRSLAKDRGLTLVLISQVDRSYDPAVKPIPGPEDLRLPNPLDLALFDKMVFMHAGEVQVRRS
jgi:replicative DNA helicase